MTIQDAMRQLEGAGAFARAAAGDQRAASLFVRQAAWLANPTGDPGSWGWLSKSGGEGGVDADDGHRYAEDALCLGADPSNLNNVYDLVGGTGAPGARINYNPGASPRRPSNQWVAPHALSAGELAYIGAGSGGGGTGGGGSTPTDLRPVIEAIATLRAEVVAIRANLDYVAATLTNLDEVIRATHDYARDGKAAVEALAAKPVTVEFPPYAGSFRVLGQTVPITLRPQR